MSVWGERAATAPSLAHCRRVPRALVVVALAVALAGGAAGCGTGARRLDVEDVYARTVSARTARAAVDLHVGAPRSSTYITAQGYVDLTAPGFSIAVQEAGVNLREMLRGDQLFVEVPPSARAANRGKAWAEFGLPAGTGARTGTPPPGSVLSGSVPNGSVLNGSVLNGSLLAGSVLGVVDPAPVLEVLKLAPASTTRLGARALDGARSTEYRLDYRTTELVSAPHGGTPGAGVVSLLAQIAHPRPTELPVYVWLDSRGRLVELAMSIVIGTEPLSPSPAQAALANQLPTTLSVNIYLGHFGEPLLLVPPAADRTNRLPLAELAGGTL